jgi:hypothetical protein
VKWAQFHRHAVRRLGPDAIEQLGPRDERDAETGSRQQHAAIAWIILHIVDAALNCADGDGIGDEIGLKARLDDKQSADLAKLHHGKSNAIGMALFRPFPIKDSG